MKLFFQLSVQLSFLLVNLPVVLAWGSPSGGMLACIRYRICLGFALIFNEFQYRPAYLSKNVLPLGAFIGRSSISLSCRRPLPTRRLGHGSQGTSSLTYLMALVGLKVITRRGSNGYTKTRWRGSLCS